MRKLLISFLCLVTLVQALTAQNSIRVDVPNLVASDEQFNITFVIEGENSPSSFSWDPGSDFQLVWGPQKGSSSSTSIINGKRTHSAQTTYTYVLMPRSVGTFNIPVATATVKGEEISSPRKTIEVLASGSSSSGSIQSSGQTSSQQGKEGAGEIAAEDLFLRLTVSRTSVVVGEPITATLKLFQRVNIAGFEDARFPKFNGFWSQELQSPTNIEFQRENYNDRIYNSAVLRSWTLIPQQSGDIQIEPSELICLVNVRSSISTGNSIFDAFFQDDYRTIRKRVTSPACTVHVGALPAGAPASFAGGVGTFSIKASLSKDSLSTHDAASLFVTVSGKGNVSLLEAPKINFPPDFEVYDIKATVSGDTKTFEYPFIPRSHGEFTIPGVEYSFYDVNARRYQTVSTPEMTLKVARSASDDSAGAVVRTPSVNRKGVRDLGTDIRFIRRDFPSLTTRGSFIFASAWFWILTGLLIAAGAALLFILRAALARRSDVALTKNRAAVKNARRKLALAGDLLHKDLYSAFYEELHKALLGFVGDKLSMDLADMSKDNIALSLKDKGVDDEITAGFVELLDACEYARYAPSTGNEAMSAHYDAALKVIADIDNSMKTRKNMGAARATVIAVALLLSPLGLMADNDDYVSGLWNAGVESYGQGAWSDAIGSWTAIEDLGFQSVDLYYNIGNAYFQTEDYAHAILYYERALRLDPSDTDVKYNLDFARDFIQDDIEVIPEIFIERIGHKMCGIFSSNTWAWIWLVFLTLTIALALVFFLSRSVTRRKVSFFTGIVTLVIALLALDFSQWQYTEYRTVHNAIIVNPVVSVKSSPSDNTSKDLFVIHEGTKVRIKDQVGEWLDIELTDGRQGWVRGNDLENI